MRSLIFAGALALTLLFTGCQTPHAFPKPDSTWKSYVGQLKFSNRQRTLIGDVVVQQRGQDEFQLDFIKGGGLPLISIRQDSTISRAEGILVHGSWQGKESSAPRTLRSWMELREAFVLFAIPNWKAQAASQRDHVDGPSMPIHPEIRRGQAKYSGGQLSTLFLTFPDEDQRFVFQFNR